MIVQVMVAGFRRSLGHFLLCCLLLAMVRPAAATPYFPNLKGSPVHSITLGPNVENPGILLIVVDTLRPDHLSAYGYAQPTSPFIESVSKEGVIFANHFSNSSWTKPSMASLLTGLFPHRHKVLPVGSKLAPNILTMAQAFKDAGFKTGAVMSNSFAGRRYGMDRGFDRFAEPSSHFGGKSPIASKALAQALRWIAEDKDKPFFYVVFLFDPHDPYAPPAEYKEKFCPECKSPEITVPQREYHGHGPTAKQIADMKGLFDGEIAYADAQLRTFFDSIKTLGIDKRLSTVIVGDHGEAFGEHKVFEHAFHMWDEVVRTPLVIRSPRVTERGVYSGLTQHVDVFPTLLKLAGISRPSGLQGMSLVLDQGDPPPPPTRMVVTEVEMYGVYRVTVRNHLYKLTHHEPLNEKEFLKFYPDTRIYPSVVKGSFKRELYNLQLDPHETRDVYATERPSISSLETALERYMKTGDLDDPDAGQAPSEEVLKDLKSLGYIQ